MLAVITPAGKVRPIIRCCRHAADGR